MNNSKRDAQGIFSRFITLCTLGLLFGAGAAEAVTRDGGRLGV